MFSSLAHFPGDSLKKILCRDGNMSLTEKKIEDLPKAAKHSEVVLKYRNSQGHCYSVCICKNSSFLIVFEAVTEFLVHRGVLNPNCHGVSEAPSKHHSSGEWQGYSQGFATFC